MAVDSTETWDGFYENCYYEGQGYLLYGNPGFELGTPKDSQDPGLLQPLNIARRLDVRKAHASAMTPQAGFGGPPGGIFSKLRSFSEEGHMCPVKLLVPPGFSRCVC